MALAAAVGVGVGSFLGEADSALAEAVIFKGRWICCWWNLFFLGTRIQRRRLGAVSGSWSHLGWHQLGGFNSFGGGNVCGMGSGLMQWMLVAWEVSRRIWCV